MYDVFNQAVIVSQVAAYKAQQLPGYTGLLPLRIAHIDKNVEYLTATAKQAGTLCPACGRVLFTTEPFITVGAHWEPSLVTVSTQDIDGEQLIRVQQPQGPLHHRRCWKRRGEIRKWVPLAELERWLHSAGASLVDRQTTHPDLEFEFVIDDLFALHPTLRSIYGVANRGVLYVPEPDQRTAT